MDEACRGDGCTGLVRAERRLLNKKMNIIKYLHNF